MCVSKYLPNTFYYWFKMLLLLHVPFFFNQNENKITIICENSLDASRNFR